MSTIWKNSGKSGWPWFKLRTYLDFWAKGLRPMWSGFMELWPSENLTQPRHKASWISTSQLDFERESTHHLAAQLGATSPLQWDQIDDPQYETSFAGGWNYHRFGMCYDEWNDNHINVHLIVFQAAIQERLSSFLGFLWSHQTRWSPSRGFNSRFDWAMPWPSTRRRVNPCKQLAWTSPKIASPMANFTLDALALEKAKTFT